MKRKPWIWCDYCNAEISFTAVKACLHKPCKTKSIVKEKERESG